MHKISPQRDLHVQSTHRASHNVHLAVARDGVERDVPLLIDPTPRTLEISPALRNKAAKAIKREVRRIKFGLYLSLARLYLAKFALECRSLSLRIAGKISGQT